MSKTFDRINCVVCKSEIEHVLTFENFPIYMGTNIFVKNPKALLDIQNPYVIIRTAQYKEEIVSQLNNLNPNIRFI